MIFENLKEIWHQQLDNIDYDIDPINDKELMQKIDSLETKKQRTARNVVIISVVSIIVLMVMWNIYPLSNLTSRIGFLLMIVSIIIMIIIARSNQITFKKYYLKPGDFILYIYKKLCFRK